MKTSVPFVGLLLCVSIVSPHAFRLTASAKPTAAEKPEATASDHQEQAPTRREIHLTAKRYAFSPAAVVVLEGDVVKITLETDDIPHSFTMDDYRIAKRANPGHAVVFEFRADRAGTFPFYCNLAQERGCRDMRGALHVKKR